MAATTSRMPLTISRVLVQQPASRHRALMQAYAACARMARSHYENFPVASLLLPRVMRPHVAAVYAFARIADDFADEGLRTIDERHRLLDDWIARLHRSVNGPADGDDARDHAATFTALGHTIRTCDLPVSLFEDLVSAFRQDVTVTRYERWDDLLDYCRRSANPVGRLVLRIAGLRDADADRGADAVCTALQLTNFWQDLEIDWRKGRLYVPRSDLARFSAQEADLDARRLTPAWEAVMANAAARTRALFAAGRSVCDAVGGRLGLELRLTWLGGTTVLDRLERGRFDVFRRRPSLRARDVGPLLWRALRWQRAAAR
jgi:squalene synthase HpnC